MSGKPFYTPAARTDLRGIALYIARDNPDRAISFVAEIRAHCGRLATQPTIHRLREDLGPGTRMAVHGRYLILYSLRDDGRVVIERVIHGAHDLDRLDAD